MMRIAFFTAIICFGTVTSGCRKDPRPNTLDAEISERFAGDYYVGSTYNPDYPLQLDEETIITKVNTCSSCILFSPFPVHNTLEHVPIRGMIKNQTLVIPDQVFAFQASYYSGTVLTPAYLLKINGTGSLSGIPHLGEETKEICISLRQFRMYNGESEFTEIEPKVVYFTEKK